MWSSYHYYGALRSLQAASDGCCHANAVPLGWVQA
jgi:hypothetical protein